MVSFFAEVKVFRFWPKTMDYNKALDQISLRPHNSPLEVEISLLLSVHVYNTCTHNYVVGILL